MLVSTAREALARREIYVCPRCAVTALAPLGARRFQNRRQLHLDSQLEADDAFPAVISSPTAQAAGTPYRAREDSSLRTHLARTRRARSSLVQRSSDPQCSHVEGPKYGRPGTLSYHPFSPSLLRARSRSSSRGATRSLPRVEGSSWRLIRSPSRIDAPVDHERLIRRLDRARKSAMEAIRKLKETFKEEQQGKRDNPAPITQNNDLPPAAPATRLKQSKAKWEALSKENKLKLVPIDIKQPSPPRLSYGLDRVLFNPGVYRLQDPRSGVYNFDPYLEEIMPVDEFDFDALRKFVTSSEDETLTSIAGQKNKKYSASTSSMTNILSHFHFLLSSWRPPNMSMLSEGFPKDWKSFTSLTRAPASGVLIWKNGMYALDADKEFSTASVLSLLGRSMEKLLTLNTSEFEQYRKSRLKAGSQPPKEIESYNYTTAGDFIFRSQLDASDPRLPGKGIFDVKTRAVVAVRMDSRNPEHGSGYEILTNLGEWESFEREYYDLIRAAFLKYSLQVRMGRMDGIFVAYHNTERIFGFQYVPLSEMDLALHGQTDPTLGETEFKFSIGLLNKLLNKATARFPEQSLRVYCETRGTREQPFMYFIAKPMSDTEIEERQRQDEEEAKFDGSQEKQDASVSEVEDPSNYKVSDITRIAHALEEARLGSNDHSATIAEEDPPEPTEVPFDEYGSDSQLDEIPSPGPNVLDMSSSGIFQDASASEDLMSESQFLQDDLTVDLAQQIGLDEYGTFETLEGAIDASMRENEEGNGSDFKEEVDEDTPSTSEEQANGEDHSSTLYSNTKLPTESAPQSREDVLVLKVRIRHWSGSKERELPPSNLKVSSPSWQISHSFEEIGQAAAQRTYEACKVRRKNILQRSKPWTNAYLAKLREMSKKGKERRTKLETAKAKTKKVVFTSGTEARK